MRLIDADVLEKSIENEVTFIDGDSLYKIIDIINKAPIIIKCDKTSDGLPLMDLRPRPRGGWITVKQDTILGAFEVKNKVCDQCNHATKYEYPFCPWCGADMQKCTEVQNDNR